MARSKRSVNDVELPYEPEPQQVNAELEIDKEAYRQRLAEYLKDPEFRKIEGFPIGTDEAILALSDPPYYTACPNPFLPEILEQWQQERRELRKELSLPDDENPAPGYRPYRREPYAADVSEGKNDPIYNAHSYHTKVPHKAIMRYILHYTDPGDVVLDGFCGTGMTGVAAQLCGDKKVVESLGYKVKADGVILDENGEPISRLGARRAVLNELSPAATFIAYNYNTPVYARAFEREAKHILKEVEDEYGWMYKTWYPNCDDPNCVEATINYVVWSDVFICPHCGYEMIFWDVAIDKETRVVLDDWNCPNCSSILTKSPNNGTKAIKIERAVETFFDHIIGKTTQQVKQVPVLINITVGNQRKEKKPDWEDLELIKRIDQQISHHEIPSNPMMFIGGEWGDSWRAGYHTGIIYSHQFYTRRSLIIYSILSKHKSNPIILFLLSSANINASKLYRFRANGKGGNLSGTLYLSSTPQENNVFQILNRKFQDIVVIPRQRKPNVTISCASSTNFLPFLSERFDYLFIDPPFGGNLMYSELNFVWETWLSIITNNISEAIVNTSQKKGLHEYYELMETCFSEFYKLLKPGRWMTIEFHNSQNSVWNSIQEAISQSGFIVADVRTLDKQQGSFKQVISNNAVKQDLVISAYKPSREFEAKFISSAGTENGVWDFVHQHLNQLPPPSLTKNQIEIQLERLPYLLFDRMIAFHLVRSLIIPISSSEFYAGLSQKYLVRDGMVFTAIQANEYDSLRMKVERVEQLSLFVSDEKTLIQWLRQDLDPINGTGPQAYGDLMPRLMLEIHQSPHEALPEIITILEQNFLQDEKKRWYVPDLNRQADLEQLRTNALIREFAEYGRYSGQLLAFRSEAIRAGFSKAWKERDYDTIVAVAERLPEQVLQEDASLKMYYDNALSRASHQLRQERLI